MDAQKTSVIKMINQISDNIGLHFTSEQAVDKVVEHIELFWARSMKNDLIAYNQDGGELLNTIAQLAAVKLTHIKSAGAA